MPDRHRQQVDLTDKNALVAAFKKHPEELWASFGTAPLFKDYDVNKVVDYIESVIKKDKVYISPEKKDEILNTLKKYGRDGRKAMQYITNLFLKGAGLGLKENQEKLLRNVIREEIKRILNEGKKYYQDGAEFFDYNTGRVIAEYPKYFDIKGAKETQKLFQKEYGHLYSQFVDADGQPIKEQIIKEKDLGERGSEKKWNSDFQEKKDFLKKFNKQKFMNLSFNELPGNIQKAWEDYIK
jgi:hypothetical protein